MGAEPRTVAHLPIVATAAAAGRHRRSEGSVARLSIAKSIDIGQVMALTRSFKETIQARLVRDTAFRDALFGEAIDAFLQGDPKTGKAVLRDLINGTVGFEKLARRIQRPSKSLHRMLGSRGKPTTENFFAVMHALQRETGVRLEVRVRKR
jgi:DNA-binding phage protein